MKTTTLVAWISYALFFLFMYASISKLIAFEYYLYDLTRSPLLKTYALTVAIAVPALEFITAALLVPGKTRVFGLASAVILLLLFTGYVLYVLSFTKDRPCTCGGIVRQLTWPQHLVFNLAFLLLAIAGFCLQHISFTLKNKYHEKV
ncbi:MauE/DoxX family redox-associated membrane protein [Chitinophaga filiformis]|uniref:Methylamine utilisation protein MauE domain-containing protein n=1 Tax=Chitinophaga filiformis TaxID=104663 RepID=A0ABY4HWL8_CHIFI|nr:MauE/DoxX family redox-associated membrane protein [Chitinophaga filiformis]UPK67990.1 hypothetical protein MYF79_23850 [Chitinophaga filiformis]